MRDLFRKMFAAAALLYAGCATVPQPQTIGMLSADELKAHLERTAAVSGAFSAEGTITVNSPSMNQSAGFDLFTRGGDSVKMAVYGPFGITVGTALFTRTEFTAYNALNNTVYRGNPERQMKMLPFIKDIPFELLVGSLQGKHPLLPAVEIDSVTITASRSYTFTSIVSDSVVDRFTVDGDLLRITKCSRRTAAGTVLWRVEYSYT
ncbi:MAG: DUF4292 domain-containing protein [Ignavibacteriales bacterium]|nr:DUF4292 domain-containing protein [Ignavibacteriales bacterium]